LEPIIPGKGKISIIDTVYGRIASVICADLDYPFFCKFLLTSPPIMMLINPI